MPPVDKTPAAADVAPAPVVEAPAPAAVVEVAPAPPVSVVEPVEVTLEEFCAGASAQGHGPEMLAGFHHDQARQGVIKATSGGFAAALEAFANRPVG